MKQILLCEDEAVIREFIVIHLRRCGFDVVEAGTAEEALELYARNKENVRMAVLDLMLPGMDGFELCRRLREQDPTMGILMLTARSQEPEKIKALKLGADDYVTKPFSPSELTARVEALERRVNASAGVRRDDLVSGEFTLNVLNRTLYRNGAPVELTQVEFQIMEYFLTHAGELLSRSDILGRMWGADYYGEDQIVDVNIRRLRMKIEENPSEPRHIVTVWGSGYRWDS